MTPIPETTREYRQHRITAEIFALEFLNVPDQPRELCAARKCSRPEEQSFGALPVLALQPVGDDFHFARQSMRELIEWQPPIPPEEAVKRVLAAQRKYDDLAAAYKLLRAKERAADKELEGAGEEVRKQVRLLAEASDPSKRPPLFAVAEAVAPPVPPPADPAPTPMPDPPQAPTGWPSPESDPDLHDAPDEGDELPL
jgi:hypothetical protein